MPDMAPAPASGEQGSQLPMGVSPVTGPTPNKGYEAAGMQKLGIIVKLMTDALPLLGAQSEAGQELLKMLQKLAKMVPDGASTQASERNNLESMMLRNQQQAQQVQQMRQAQAGPPANAQAAQQKAA